MHKTVSTVRMLIALLIFTFVLFTSSAQQQAQKPVTITAFIITPSQQPTPDNRIFKRIKDEFGISFQFDIMAGDVDQKLGVMIASGDYPDLINVHQRFIAAGALIPLEDLITKNAPRLKKHYEDCWELMKDKNGHIYVLPNFGVFHGKYTYNESWGPSFWIQKAVLKEFGYPKVKTLDEYFELIRKYKAKYPVIDGQATIGFEILCEGWRDWPLRNPPEHLIGQPNEGDAILENGVARVFADRDFAKRYYKKLNEMNKIGLIDKETFVLSYDQYLSKLSSGRVLGMFDQRWNFARAETSLNSRDKVLRTWAPCPVTYDTSIKDHYLDRPVVNITNGFGISIKAKDPVRIIKLLDALMDEKWQKFIQWGVQGEDYLVDKNGRYYRTQAMRDKHGTLEWRQGNTGLEFAGTIPKLEGTYSDGNATSPGMQPEEFYAGLYAEDKEILKVYGFKSYAEFFSPPPPNAPHYPIWNIVIPEGSPARIAQLKMIDLGKKYLPRCILTDPKKFDSVWDTYVKELKKVNIKAYEDAVNAGIKERLAKVAKKP